MKIEPCPNQRCLNTEPTLMMQDCFVWCRKCQMCSPKGKNSVDALDIWNSLPRLRSPAPERLALEEISALAKGAKQEHTGMRTGYSWIAEVCDKALATPPAPAQDGRERR